MSRQDFVPRWRQHGALGMAQPRGINVERYVHCDMVTGIGMPQISEDYDGVGIVLFRSEAHLQARNQETGSQKIMETDEFETFDRPVKDSAQFFVEHEIIPAPTAPLTLLRFIWRPPSAAAATFRDELKLNLPQHAKAVEDLAKGYVFNEPYRATDNRTGLACDGVEELWFDDSESLKTALARLTELQAAHPDLITVTLATNQVVLHQK